MAGFQIEVPKTYVGRFDGQSDTLLRACQGGCPLGNPEFQVVVGTPQGGLARIIHEGGGCGASP